MKKANPISRRRFLGQASCAGITATPLLSTLLNMKMVSNALGNEQTQDPNDYKALVCLFLAGGNDSYNMLVPADTDTYADYQRARTNMALAKNTLLPLNGTHHGKQYGLHPRMPEVQNLYNNGKLGFVANVGTLVEPTNLKSWTNGSARLPEGLFSHSDQIMHWQTGVPDRRSASGWGGRMADLLNSNNSNQRISMNISLSGTNTFQSGNATTSYEIEPEGNGSILLDEYDTEDGAVAALGRAAVNDLMDARYQNLFTSAFAHRNRASIDAAQEFSTAIRSTRLITPFDSNPVSSALQMVARTIAARKTLGMRRQTFFILFDGWDHHDELLNTYATMIPVISRALGEFDQALTELSLNDQVTTFTASDFARTLSSNGKGTDHAWGGNQMVMGGAVKGGKIYGDYPALAPKNELDTGRGRLIPTLSTDEYFAELARWFGVADSDLTSVFPNLDRFFSPKSGAPIGFMV